MVASAACQSELVRELTRPQLLELADRSDAPQVSIYLATSRMSSPAAQRVLWMNLLRSAERQLTTDGLVGRDARRILAPARRVIDTRHAQARGVAYFASSRWSRVLSLAIDVPTTAVVGDCCYLRPLLPLLDPTDHYYVLGLSRDEVRFFAGNRELVKELSLVDLPLAPLASMPRERRPAGAFVAEQGSAGIRGVWHGVGGSTFDIDKQRIVAHFREVDAAVRKILGNSGAPLVLGGVAYLHALYRGVNSYPTLMPEGIIGGLGDMTSTQLHERAWPLVEPTLHTERRKALARFAQLDGSGRTFCGLSEAASASADGRIETLIVAAGASDDRMLFEQAIVETLRHDGTVHVVDPESLPTSTAIAGILRY